MTLASVPIGITAGAPPLTGLVYAGDSGIDLTTVTACSLQVLDPKGKQSTWTATVPAIPTAWAPSTTYALLATAVPMAIATGLQYECTSRTPTTWLANTKYSAGATVSPPSSTGYVYQCLTSGQSGGSAPTWPLSIGSTVLDGSAVWICAAAVNSSSTNEPAWPLVAGQTVIDSALVWTCTGPVTTSAQLQWSHAWSAGGVDVTLVGAYQIAPLLTIPAGTVPVPPRTLVATGIFGGAI